MFLRMIRKDLKDSKGLNFILLLFMIIVATLASAGGLLQLENTRGISVSRQRCKAADAYIIYSPAAEELNTGPDYLISFLQSKMPDCVIAWQPMIPISSSNFHFTGKDPAGFQGMSTHYYLSTQPMDMDLIYDEKNRPFYVENGCVAVTRQFARGTGVTVGDTLTITTQMGSQYEFRISAIAKDPTKEWHTGFFLSDADFALIAAECPYQRQIVYVQDSSLHTDTILTGTDPLYSLLRDFENDSYLYERILTLNGDCHLFSNYAVISYIVFLFVMIAGVFMLIIIVFTLSFSIRSAVKKEERELGIMKALGTDSFSFRWIFAAKYIAFAVTGGIIGFAAGVLAGSYLLDNFYYNITYILSPVDLLPSILASALITVLVIFFIFLSLRRIDRISVMDAISGENRAESIRHPGSRKPAFLQKLPVPLYLAIADITSKFRRYVLLLIAFAAGSILVMYSIQLHDTMISKDFLHKYYTFGDLDFGLRSSSEFINEMSNNTGRCEIAEHNINARLRNSGIPASVDFAFMTNANLCTDSGYTSVVINAGIETDRLHIVKGGQLPALRNEILIDRYFALSNGYQIGDPVTIEYDKYDADRLSHEKTKEEFVITGFVDRLSRINSIDVITSRDFHDAVIDYHEMVGFRIDAPEEEKPGYALQIKKMFPDAYIEPMEVGGNFLSMYGILFAFVRNTMMIVAAGVLTFMTVMYQVLFMKDEENETAMLKSCGFDNSSIKQWQLLRMLLLFAAAQVLAAVLMPTAVTWGNNLLIRNLLGLTSWEFSGSWVPCALWIALISALMVCVEMIVLRGIEKIEIWRIRNE